MKQPISIMPFACVAKLILLANEYSFVMYFLLRREDEFNRGYTTISVPVGFGFGKLPTTPLSK